MWLPPLQVGFPAVVLEREGGPREEGSAITFWPNAFRVLDALVVAAPVRDTHPLLHRCADLVLMWHLSSCSKSADAHVC